MECKDTKEKLSAYMDGELDGALMKTVADHLEVCEACRDELGRMEAAWNLLDGVTVPQPSPGLKERILQNAAEPSRPGAGAFSWRSLKRWPMSLMAAAAVFFGVVFGGLLGQAYTSGPQTVSAEPAAAAEKAEEDVFSELPEGTVGWYLADLLVAQETSKGDEEDAK